MAMLNNQRVLILKGLLDLAWLLVILRPVCLFRSGMLQTASPLELLGLRGPHRNSSRAVPIVNSKGAWLKCCLHTFGRKSPEQVQQLWDLLSSCVICSHRQSHRPSFIGQFGIAIGHILTFLTQAEFEAILSRRFWSMHFLPCVAAALWATPGLRVFGCPDFAPKVWACLSGGNPFIPISMKYHEIKSLVGDTWDM